VLILNICVYFGKNLKQLRKQKKLTQEKLAEYAGLDRTYIGGIERGERNISLINIEKIAKALDIEIYEFFQNKDLIKDKE